MRTFLTLVLLMAVCAPALADPVPSFRAEAVFDSPLYAEPMKSVLAVVDGLTEKIDGFRTTQSTIITVDCGDSLDAKVVARLQPNALNGGQTAFLTAAFTASTTNPHPSECQKQALAMLPPMSIDVEIQPGTQDVNVKHRDMAHLVYSIHLTYTPNFGPAN